MSAITDRLAPAMLLAFCVAGCADIERKSGQFSAALPYPITEGTRVETPDNPLECVPYARARSGIQF